MTTVFNYEGFEDNFLYKREVETGVQYVFRFNNNYGASIVKRMIGDTPATYGAAADLWELAVLYFPDDTDGFLISYDSGLTAGVLGCLTEEQGREYLERIRDLKE